MRYDGRTEGNPMIYETPATVEVRMDAEIGSYQDDFDRDRDDVPTADDAPAAD
jgi:hypothetical protein